MQNLQGDICQIIDANGAVVVEYTYDAWGKVLNVTGSMAGTLGKIQPFRYRGYVYDVETELYYLRSRHYHSEIGRFLNSDSIVADNTFSYCSNNPVHHVDTNGKEYVNCLDDMYHGIFLYGAGRIKSTDFIERAYQKEGVQYEDCKCSTLIDFAALQKEFSKGMSSSMKENALIYGEINDIGYEWFIPGTVLAKLKSYNGKQYEGGPFDASKIKPGDVEHGGIFLGFYHNNGDLIVRVLQSTSSKNPKLNIVRVTEFSAENMTQNGWNIWYWDQRVNPDIQDYE